MRRSRLLPLAALAALAVAAVPAADPASETTTAEGCALVDLAETPEDTADDVEVCESQSWIVAGATPLSNATAATLSADAPTAPLGGAALGGSATDIAAQGDPAHGLEVVGTITGPVDTIDVEVYLGMVRGYSAAGHGVTPAVEINGFDFGGSLVDAEVTEAENGVAVMRFRLENLLDLWPLLKFDTGADVEHSLRINLSPYYVGDDGAYLYGGSEVPSNVVLNKAG